MFDTINPIGLRGRLAHRRLMASLERERIALTKVEEICKDCGIDLPTTWHWDGCKEAKR